MFDRDAETAAGTHLCTAQGKKKLAEKQAAKAEKQAAKAAAKEAAKQEDPANKSVTLQGQSSARYPDQRARLRIKGGNVPCGWWQVGVINYGSWLLWCCEGVLIECVGWCHVESSWSRCAKLATSTFYSCHACCCRWV